MTLKCEVRSAEFGVLQDRFWEREAPAELLCFGSAKLLLSFFPGVKTSSAGASRSRLTPAFGAKAGF